MDVSAPELKERLTSRVKTATLLTIAMITLDSLLPHWTIPAILVVSHVRQGIMFDGFPRDLGCSVSTRLYIAAAWPLSLAVFLVAAPVQFRLLIYDNIFGYFFRFAVASGDMFYGFGVPETTAIQWMIHRDLFCVRILCSIAWIYTAGKFPSSPSLVVWTIIPVALFLSALGIWGPFRPRLVDQGRWAQWHPHHGLQVLDYASHVFSAYCLAQIPRTIQRRQCRAAYRDRQGDFSLRDHQYAVLEAGHIRLLILRKTSSRFSGTVEASLVHSPLHSTPQYEAISYRWGNSNTSEEILIDGCRARVTRSAFDVLLSCRSTSGPRTIWLDAICINQEDDVEKATQVNLMNQIYSSAWRVLIFPTANWRWRLAARILLKKGSLPALYNQFDVIEKWVLGRKLRTVKENLGQQVYESEAADDATNAFSPLWLAMMELVRDRYWTRMWITQEVSVAKRVDLYLSGLYVPWDVYTATLGRLMHTENRALLSLACAYHEQYQWNVDISKNLMATTIHSALRSSTSTQPWVAGFDDAQRRSLEALLHDTKSAADVYQAVARYLLCSPQNPSTGCLAFAGIGFSTQRKRMPSWVPDFGEKRCTTPLTHAPYVPATVYTAGGSQYIDPVVRPGRSSGCIEVEGFTCDSILGLTDDALLFGNEKGQDADVFSVLRDKHEFVLAAVDVIEHCLKPAPALLERYIVTYLPDALTGGFMAYYEPPEFYADAFPIWFRTLSQLQGIRSWNDALADPQKRKHLETLQSGQTGVASVYDAHVIATCYGRKFAITTEGSLCTVPSLAQIGDVVFVPKGARTPFLIRPKPAETEEGLHELVGECYVQGIMRGQAADMVGDGSREVTVALV
nr:heterokaryon incompatibility protein 6, or allele [Quercus suber]